MVSTVQHITRHLAQLRYLQTLCTISAENNSTIIFPVPVDTIASLVGRVRGGK